MPDDRISSKDADKKLPKPEVYIVRNGQAVFKPGMKTWFIETRKGSGKESGVVREDFYGALGSDATICNCNTETAPETICTCDMVCTCEVTCTCQATCACQSTCTCQFTGGWCTCNQVCTCVPVT